MYQGFLPSYGWTLLAVWTGLLPAEPVLLEQGWVHTTAAAETGWKEVRK